MMMLAVCSLGLPTSSLKLECYANILGDVKPCSYVIVNYLLYKYADFSLWLLWFIFLSSTVVK